MILSLAACGGEITGYGEKPSGGIADIDGGSTTDPGVSQQQPPDMPDNQHGSPDKADDLSGVTGDVTVEGEKVIHTTNDGSGNISVMEYICDGSALSKVVLTMKCKDSSAASLCRPALKSMIFRS